MTDAELMSAFEAAAIPEDAWHHAEHVRVAWGYLRRVPPEEALDAMRAGLARLVAAYGVVDGPDRGYHETVTRAWVMLVDATMRHYGAEESSEAFLAAHPHFQRTLLRLYYSPARIRHPDAKHRFVEPDLAPLPR